MTAHNLTGRQEAFAIAIAKGMQQREAYAAAGYSMRGSLASIDSKACRLAASEPVRARVRVLRASAAEEAMWDLTKAANTLKTTLAIAHAKVRASAVPDDKGMVPSDVPREATRAVLSSVAELNRLFHVDDASPDDHRAVIIDDL